MQPREPAYTTKQRWYGWETLIGLAITDGALIGGGAALESGWPIVAGFIMRPFVGPIVHWQHGHVGRGFGSLGLNVGVPFTLGAVGAAATGDNCNRSLGCLAGFVLGYFIGSIVAPIIDVAALSTEKVEVPVEPEALHVQSLTVVPILDKGRTGLGLAGQF
jgi:hypothetical protein